MKAHNVRLKVRESVVFALACFTMIIETGCYEVALRDCECRFDGRWRYEYINESDSSHVTVVDLEVWRRRGRADRYLTVNDTIAYACFNLDVDVVDCQTLRMEGECTQVSGGGGAYVQSNTYVWSEDCDSFWEMFGDTLPEPPFVRLD
tara:strand:+ start:5269 stop:5712 length:444 start_codon:yes stop_codon:yes gene_type:complete